MTALNSFGQGEMVFRLLIGMIMGLAILVVIVSLIDTFSKQQVEIGEELLYDGFKIALQNLTTENSSDVVVKKNIILSPKIYSPYTFALKATVPKECIHLQAASYFDFEGDAINVKNQIKTNVYYKCISLSSSCPICCIVSFGKPISTGDTC